METSSQSGIQTLAPAKNLQFCQSCRLSIVNGRIQIVHTYQEGCGKH